MLIFKERIKGLSVVLITVIPADAGNMLSGANLKTCNGTRFLHPQE
jgi:hypothetical protein